MMVTGIILVLLGALWIFQGLGLVGGSFMTGQSQWLYIGIAVVIAGFLMLLWRSRRGSKLR